MCFFICDTVNSMDNKSITVYVSKMKQNFSILDSHFHTKHIQLNGTAPFGKLCVPAVKLRCDLLTASLKLVASFQPLGHRCVTLKPSKVLVRKESNRINRKNAINRAS